MFLRRELVLISNKLSSETLNANSDQKNAEKIIENTEKSLYDLAEKGTFSQSYQKFNKALIKQLKWLPRQCKMIRGLLVYLLV